MDLQQEITLSDKNGGNVTLPFINLLRITMVKFQEYFLVFQQETGHSDIVTFNKWMQDKLDMTGKHVL